MGTLTLAALPVARASYVRAAAAAAAAVVMTALVPAFAERSTFLLALAVVILTAWKSGWRAGVVGAATSFAMIAVMMPPTGGWFSPTGNDGLRFTTFAGLTAASLIFARAREIAEAQARRAEALAKIVVENGPVLIAGADERGNTVIFNRACEELTGRSRADVLGRPFFHAFVPDAWQSEVIAPHGDRMIAWRCFRVVQDDGLPLTVGVGQDVTERHAAREALAKADQRKEHFIALLAHELRTPLNAAMGWFHIHRTGQPETAVARSAEAVERNLQMMHGLIEDIVDFNRAEFGKLTLNRMLVDVAALISDVVTSARSIADARQIAMRLSIESSIPGIDADPKRLRQVLLNVLSNALKFTQPGGEVRVSARGSERGLEISVVDNGPGIAPEHIERIFDPMYQPGGGERSDGLGLGLALVKRLVEAHGGRVTITSGGAGQGTAVLIVLPVQGTLPSEVAV
jgi:signal transduction histidine kinase